jgi:hypothetical protein
VVLCSIGTCSNRAAAVASSHHLAMKLGRPFRVVWQPEEACPDSFEALFDVKVDVMEEFYPWEVNYKYMGKYCLCIHEL